MHDFRKMLEEGRHPVQAALAAPGALQAEMIAKLGFESVMIDFQHGMMDLEGVFSMLVAISTSEAVPMVRVPWNEPSIIMKMLDAGAYGIVCPMVETAEETERFVAACRYPPEGWRSLGATRAAIGRFGEYLGSANRSILTIAQIETKVGCDNLHAILQTPGLDALFPGPADLALAYGESPADGYASPAMEMRLRRIIDACRSAGVCVTLPAGDASTAELLYSWGVDWVSTGPEWIWMTAGASQILNSLRAIGTASSD